ncbi:unnamed protein product [Ascophyllum nodosum]
MYTMGFSRQYTVDLMLLPFGNPIKCHEVLSLQPMIPPTKRLTFPPLTGGCSEGLLDAFRFFLNTSVIHLSNANPARGHKEVRRSTGHIMVTARYSNQLGSKLRQNTCQVQSPENTGNLSASTRCVKKSKRGACEQKAATVLPNRTAAT